ncbi:MAG TPA: penicillin-binding transpeptidase domain-containing protein, partial [Candidatus Binatia bacterium]|nr:penicillin-binding transpeptidase domain-containing protein [Candidatus Binatia bacterium]
RCGREPHGELALANLAVGHGDISLTTVHAAVLAALIAQNGVLVPPYLIEDAKSILNLGYYSHHAEPRQLLADDLNFRRVKKAMATVVTDGKGTGHRAGPAAGLAVKTGSSSDGRGGFDALVIGFYPVANPRFAFAFRLENAGRAELNGALFLRDLAAILGANE